MRSVEARFWAKVNKTETCWLWTGNKSSSGYGGFQYPPMRSAHRVSYEWANGPIPDGLHIDHLCRTPLCVRPDHLEAVTPRENLMRGRAPHVLLHLTDTCKNGHDLAEHGRMRTHGRRCWICEREARQERTVREAQIRKAQLEARGPLKTTRSPARAVRRWARDVGYAPPATGPLSQDIIAAFLAAHPEEGMTA